MIKILKLLFVLFICFNINTQIQEDSIEYLITNNLNYILKKHDINTDTILKNNYITHNYFFKLKSDTILKNKDIDNYFYSFFNRDIYYNINKHFLFKLNEYFLTIDKHAYIKLYLYRKKTKINIKKNKTKVVYKLNVQIFYN